MTFAEFQASRREVKPHSAAARKLAQYKAWQSGALIQRAMPQLNDDQREFFRTGTTPREWVAMLPHDDKETKGDDTCQ